MDKIKIEFIGAGGFNFAENDLNCNYAYLLFHNQEVVNVFSSKLKAEKVAFAIYKKQGIICNIIQYKIN